MLSQCITQCIDSSSTESFKMNRCLCLFQETLAKLTLDDQDVTGLKMQVCHLQAELEELKRRPRRPSDKGVGLSGVSKDPTREDAIGRAEVMLMDTQEQINQLRDVRPFRFQYLLSFWFMPSQDQAAREQEIQDVQLNIVKSEAVARELVAGFKLIRREWDAQIESDCARFTSMDEALRKLSERNGVLERENKELRDQVLRHVLERLGLARYLTVDRRTSPPVYEACLLEGMACESDALAFDV